MRIQQNSKIQTSKYETNKTTPLQGNKQRSDNL